MNTTTFKSLIDRYNALAYTHEYIWGFEYKGNIYMTYSTDKAYSLPTGIIAFRVTDYKEAEEVKENKKKKKTSKKEK